ncbi:hypothetical protein GQ53DRAFT_845706 [Thozetella sp. PMI_491]|nr:hypothetical protein GQ53DRAFT_845706 [Thozetella sp. PMI_491]
METVACNCAGCGHLVGRFLNLWNQIGKTYFSPVVDGERTPSMVPKGAIRTGSQGTLVEGCELQDQACGKCGAMLGIKCLSAPVNHALHDNQLMLNLASSVAVSGDDGEHVEVSVTRRFKLQIPSAGMGGRPASPDPNTLEQILVQLETHGQAIDLIHKAGSNSIFKLDEKLDGFSHDLGNMRRDFSESQTRLSSLVGQVQRISEASGDQNSFDQIRDQIASVRAIAEDTIGIEELKKEIDTIKLDHSHLETQIDAVNSQLAEVQRKTMASISKLKTEMTSSLKKELSALRDEMTLQQVEMMEKNRGLPSEISALRDEMTRYKKHVDQIHSKELSKLRSELSKQQKVSDRTWDGQMSAIRNDVASGASKANARHAELSKACRENTELQEKLEATLLEAVQSLDSDLSQHKTDIDSIREECLRRENLEQFKEQLDDLRDEVRDRLSSFPKHLEVLKSRIAEIGDRASQVDNLKMDVEILQLQATGNGRQDPETIPGQDPQTTVPNDDQSRSNAENARPTQTEPASRGLKRRRSAPARNVTSDLDELAEEEASPIPFRKHKPKATVLHHLTITGSRMNQVGGPENGDLPSRPKKPRHAQNLRPRRSTRSQRRATTSLDDLAELFGD